MIFQNLYQCYETFGDQVMQQAQNLIDITKQNEQKYSICKGFLQNLQLFAWQFKDLFNKYSIDFKNEQQIFDQKTNILNCVQLNETLQNIIKREKKYYNQLSEYQSECLKYQNDYKNKQENPQNQYNQIKMNQLQYQFNLINNYKNNLVKQAEVISHLRKVSISHLQTLEFQLDKTTESTIIQIFCLYQKNYTFLQNSFNQISETIIQIINSLQNGQYLDYQTINYQFQTFQIKKDHDQQILMVQNFKNDIMQQCNDFHLNIKILKKTIKIISKAINYLQQNTQTMFQEQKQREIFQQIFNPEIFETLGFIEIQNLIHKNLLFYQQLQNILNDSPVKQYIIEDIQNNQFLLSDLETAISYMKNQKSIVKKDMMTVSHLINQQDQKQQVILNKFKQVLTSMFQKFKQNFNEFNNQAKSLAFEFQQKSQISDFQQILNNDPNLKKFKTNIQTMIQDLNTDLIFEEINIISMQQTNINEGKFFNQIDQNDQTMQLNDVLPQDQEIQIRFQLPILEKILYYFSCALKDKILLQGYLYVTTNFCCFQSLFNNTNIFFGQTKLVIPNSHVKNVKLGNQHIFDSSIIFETDKGQLEFHSIFQRESAYEDLNHIFKNYQENLQLNEEDQECEPEKIDQEQLIDENELLNSRKKSIDKVCISSDQFTDPIRITHEFENTNVLNIFRVIYSDSNKIFGHENFVVYFNQHLQNDYDLNIQKWDPIIPNFFFKSFNKITKEDHVLCSKRTISYMHKLNSKISFMPKESQIIENQTVYFVSQNHFFIENIINNKKIQYCDNFQILAKHEFINNGQNVTFNFTQSVQILKSFFFEKLTKQIAQEQSKEHVKNLLIPQIELAIRDDQKIVEVISNQAPEIELPEENKNMKEFMSMQQEFLQNQFDKMNGKLFSLQSQIDQDRNIQLIQQRIIIFLISFLLMMSFYVVKY